MDYFRLYKNLYDPNILMIHKGNITFEMISLIIDSLEESVSNLEEDKKVRKKLTNTLIESLQNLGHHAEKAAIGSNSELIMILSQKNHYKVVTGNLVENAQVGQLREMIESINSMNRKQLREHYKRLISKGDFSSKGTAGLGFVDMARKTGQKLIYRFYTMDDQFSYFSCEVKVKKSQG
jgi:hypothetical protein